MFKVWCSIIFCIFSWQATASSCGAPFLIKNETDEKVSITLKSFYPFNSNKIPSKTSFEEEPFNQNAPYFSDIKVISLEANTEKNVSFRFICEQLWLNYRVKGSNQSGQLDWIKKEKTVVITK